MKRSLMKGVNNATNAPINAETSGTHQRLAGEPDCGACVSESAADGADMVSAAKNQAKTPERAIMVPLRKVPCDADEDDRLCCIEEVSCFDPTTRECRDGESGAC